MKGSFSDAVSRERNRPHARLVTGPASDMRFFSMNGAIRHNTRERRGLLERAQSLSTGITKTTVHYGAIVLLSPAQHELQLWDFKPAIGYAPGSCDWQNSRLNFAQGHKRSGAVVFQTIYVSLARAYLRR